MTGRNALLAMAALAAVTGPAPRAAGQLERQWKTSLGRAALLATGEVDTSEPGQLSGPWTASFAGGRFRVRNERTRRGGSGTFVVTGNRVRFVVGSSVAIRPGETANCTVSLHRGRLTFARVPGRSCLAWDAGVWTRAG
jgi:hypothetical protein